MRTGYLEAQAGASSWGGAYARLEAGARLHQRTAAFAFAQADRQGRMAGLGLRWTFGL